MLSDIMSATAAVRNLFKEVAEISTRRFPTEAAAREGLNAFHGALRESSSPVENVVKRLFARATVRKIESEAGEGAFKVFVQSGRQAADEIVAPTIRALRVGDLDTVARSFGLSASDLGDTTFRRVYSAYARALFPDVRVAEQALAARRALPAALKRASRELRPQSATQLLNAIRRDKELDKLVARLSEHVGRNGGVRFKYVSTFFVLTGVAGSTVAVATALHEQAKRSAGCWRVYLDPVTKRLCACKILHASCRNREYNETSACDRTPLSFDAGMCRDDTENECAHCDSTAPPGSKQYIAPSQYLEPNDLYLCRPVASVGEMLGRIVADMPDLARDVVGEVADTVFRVWDGLKYFVLFAVAAAVMLAIVYTYIRFGPPSDRTPEPRPDGIHEKGIV